ncbi:uncharacterized protein LOC120329323 [Styela clava]
MGSGGSKQKSKPGSNRGSDKRKQLLKTLGGHTGGINCMDISASGSYLLTGSDDRTARIWDLVTYENKVVLEGHSGYISCCKIWKDRFALTGSVDKTIRKWNVFSGNCVLKMEMHRGIVNTLLPFGIYLLSASYDRTVICWNVDTGQAARVLRGHKQSILPMLYVKTAEHNPMGAEDIDRNKDALITGSMDCTAKIWSIHSGTSLRTFRGHKGAILCLSMDRDKKYLYTGSTDFSIKKWNLASGTLLKSFKGHEGSVICLEMNQKLLYSASVDSTARCWVAEFGDTTRKYSGHEHMISDMKYHKGLLITSSGDNTVRVFDAKSGSLKRTFKGHKYAVNCIMAVDSMIFSASYDGTIRIWNIRDLIREKLSVDESCSSLASSEPSVIEGRATGSDVSIRNGRTVYNTKQTREDHDNESIPMSTFKIEKEESRHRTENGNFSRQKRKGTKTSNKIAPMGTQNNNNNNGIQCPSTDNLLDENDLVGNIMDNSAIGTANEQISRSNSTASYHDAKEVWEESVSVKSGSNRIESSNKGRLPKILSQLSRSSTKASLFSTPDNATRNSSYIKESDIQLHSASTFRTNSISISLPSSSDSSRAPTSKNAHNRESSDVSRKRVKTEESELPKNGSVNEKTPSRMSSADLALVDEEMRMIAVETDSTSTGYHSDKSSPQSPNQIDKKQQLPLTGKRSVLKSRLKSSIPSPVAERSAPKRSNAGKPSLWAPCSNSTESNNNTKSRKFPRSVGSRRSNNSIRSSKTPLTPKERERLENEILKMS